MIILWGIKAKWLGLCEYHNQEIATRINFAGPCSRWAVVANETAADLASLASPWRGACWHSPQSMQRMTCEQVSYEKTDEQVNAKEHEYDSTALWKSSVLRTFNGFSIHMKGWLNEKSLYKLKHTPLEREFDLETTQSRGDVQNPSRQERSWDQAAKQRFIQTR